MVIYLKKIELKKNHTDYLVLNNYYLGKKLLASNLVFCTFFLLYGYGNVFNQVYHASSVRVQHPPSRAEIEAHEKQCGGIPLKICRVREGRVNFFSSDKVELPVLP